MPSLDDEALLPRSLLGFAIDAERLNGDPTRPTVANESVKAAWLRFIVRQRGTGHCMNLPKNWSIWKPRFASGAFAM